MLRCPALRLSTATAGDATPAFRKWVVRTLTNDFRRAAALEAAAAIAAASLKPTEVVVRHAFAGVNASDVNFTAGKYRPGVQPPFDCGFEGAGTVVAVGSGVSDVVVGAAVVTQAMGAFAEYQTVPRRSLRVLPAGAAPKPEYLALELSGTTASIALEHAVAGQPIRQGEVALVTAAAGGTGQFAVQLLKKRYGCHVVATCGGAAKAAFLRELGCCDRVIDHTAEDVRTILRTEYSNKLGVVYESVGGAMFDAALESLGMRGRIIVVGAMSGYKDGTAWAGGSNSNAADSSHAPVPLATTLIAKSASVNGFFLFHHAKHIARHAMALQAMVDDGSLVSKVDPTEFRGVAAVADAVEHLHAGRNIGKVVVQF